MTSWPQPEHQGGWTPPPPMPPASPTSPPLRRRPLILGLAAAAVLSVVVIVVMSMIGTGGGGSRSTPGAAVRGYLEALSRGDAEAALGYSADQPGSREFLSDEILKRQLEKWPITDIRILGGEDENSGFLTIASVHVAAKFGNKVSDAVVDVEKSGDDWLLKSSVVRLDPARYGREGAEAMLTVFGKPAGDSPIYLFPGYQEFGATNQYLGVSGADPILLEGLSRHASANFRPEFDLNDKGNQAVRDAVKDYFASCRQSKALDPPPPCKASVSNPQNYVDGTVSWGEPDTSDVETIQVDPGEMTVSAAGRVTVPFTAQDRRGGQSGGQDSVMVLLMVDLNQTPPAVKIR